MGNTQNEKRSLVSAVASLRTRAQNLNEAVELSYTLVDALEMRDASERPVAPSQDRDGDLIGGFEGVEDAFAEYTSAIISNLNRALDIIK